MVGLITDDPKRLEEMELSPGVGYLGIVPGTIGQIYTYDYPFSFGCTFNNMFNAAAITQQLIDSGCTLIVYLSDCESFIDDEVLNVMNFDCPKIDHSKKPKLVSFTHEKTRDGKLQCVTDSQDIINKPFDTASAGVVNSCVLNDTQLLFLSIQHTKDKVPNYELLGEVLRDKLELILETDWNTYEESEVVAPPFEPVETESTSFMRLPTRFRSKDESQKYGQNPQTSE